MKAFLYLDLHKSLKKHLTATIQQILLYSDVSDSKYM